MRNCSQRTLHSVWLDFENKEFYKHLAQIDQDRKKLESISIESIESIESFGKIEMS